MNQVTGLQQNLKPVFQAMETQRRAALHALWSTLLKALVMLPLTLLPGLLLVPSGQAIMLMDVMQRLGRFFQLSPAMEANAGIAAAVLGALWLFGGLFWLVRYFVRYGRDPGWKYLADYKRKVFARVCELHPAQLTYLPDKGIPWRVLDESALFPWISDEYRSEDFFQGRVGQTDISFAEATARRERKRMRKGRIETYLDTYFRGIIFTADFHKHFHSTTRIVPAGAKSSSVREQQAVILEDPEFQQKFVTTSTDQVDARYILSTSMMRRLIEANSRFPGLRVLLSNDRMTLLLPGARDRFEPSLCRPADDQRQIDNFIRDIETILPVVDDLNLNLRIWSKR